MWYKVVLYYSLPVNELLIDNSAYNDILTHLLLVM